MNSHCFGILIALVFSFLPFVVSDTTLSPICSNDRIIDIAYASCSEPHAKHALFCPEDNNGNHHCYSICRYWHTVQPQLSNTTAVGITCSGQSENCTAECKRPGAKCAGTPAYCNYIGERNCNPSVTENPNGCFCELTYYTADYECKHQGQWCHMNSSEIQWQKVPYQFVGPTINPNPFGFELNKKRSTQSSTFMEFNQPTLRITTMTPNITFVWVSKAPVNNMYTCESNDCIIHLPPIYFVTPGQLTVTVYLGDVKDAERTFSVQETFICTFPDCVVCWEIFNTWDCIPTKAKIAVSLVLIGLILSTVCCAPLAAKLIFHCFRGLFNVFKFAVCRCYDKVGPRLREGGESTSNVFIKLQNIVEHGDTEVPLNDEGIEMNELPARQTRSTPTRRIKMPSWITTVVMTLAFVQIIVSTESICTEGFTISGTNVVCSVSGSTQSCSLQMDTLLSIPAPGASSCLTFKDPTSGDVVADLEIKYDFAVSKVDLQKQYYTSKWVGVGSSNRQCPWEEGCDTSQTCVNFVADSPINPHGLLSGNALLWPGLTECSTSCGCAGCGCFACDNACMYWRYAFQPTTPAWKVEAPHTYKLEPHISAKLTVQETTTNASVSITGFSSSIGGNFSINVVGSLSGDLVVFGARAVVSSTDGAYLTDVSPVNGPIAGAVGDIQANTANQLMTPATDAFIFPSNAVIVNIGTTEATFNYPAAGIDSLPAIHKLPLMVGGILWTMGSSQLVGLNPNPGTLLMSVATLRPLAITRTINIVCPKIISAHGQGCYNCQIGSVITLVAKSTCSDGLAGVTFSGADVQTPSVYLTQNESTVQITVQPTTASVTGTLTIAVGAYSDSIDVSWIATVQDAVDTNRTGSNINGTAEAGDGIDFNWNQFEDWLNNLSPVEQVFFWIGLVLGILAVVALIGFLVFKFGPCRRIQKAGDYVRIAANAIPNK